VLAAEQTMANQDWFQGTADAVRQSMHHFLEHEFKYALILSGDQLYQMDLNEMVQQHIDSGAEITVATQPVTAKDGTSFGILKTNEESIITSFTEKPDAKEILKWSSEVSPEMEKEGRKYLASMGIYIFNRDILIELMNDESTVDFGKEIIPQNILKHKTLGYQYEGYWADIGTIDAFFDANLDLTSPLPKFNLYDRHQRIFTRPRILPTSKISGTTINQAVIADGCIIHADKIEKSVIGIRSRIGKGSTIINTYMMGLDFYETLEEIENNRIEIMMGVGENCHIENTIIDKNCRIGDNSTIIGGAHHEEVDTENYTIRDGIVVLKKGASFPKGFVLK
jgi:glucose-1-phosphate adenylyltransferase